MKRDFSTLINKIEAMKQKLTNTIESDISKLDIFPRILISSLNLNYDQKSRKEVYEELIERTAIIEGQLKEPKPAINNTVIKYFVNNTCLMVLNEYTELFCLEDINMANIHSVIDTIDSLNNMLLYIDDKKKEASKIRSIKRIETKLLTLICYATSPLVVDTDNLLSDADFRMSYDIKHNTINVYTKDNRNLLKVLDHIKFDTYYLVFHDIINIIPEIPTEMKNILNELNKAERYRKDNLFEDIENVIRKSLNDTGLPSEFYDSSFIHKFSSMDELFNHIKNNESSRKEEMKNKFKIKFKLMKNRMEEFSKEFEEISKNIDDTINDGIISILKKSKLKTLDLLLLRSKLENSISRINDELSILQNPDKE